MSETLFISDLHLSPERPAMIELFVRFVEDRAIKATGLYILGDFFEYWIGDDDPADELSAVFSAFNTLKKNQVPVYFMHGNRDFLAAEQFAERSGCQILDEPALIKIQNQPAVLMHGDTLCTDDTKYQEFKKLVRSPNWKAEFLSKPLAARKAIVEGLRDTSKEETASKKEDIMDVNQLAVEQLMRRQQVNWLIHGHTHRPAIHEFVVDEIPRTRIVLGDWYDKGSLLSIKTTDDHQLHYNLEEFS